MGRTGLEGRDRLPCLLKHKKERRGEGRRKGERERENVEKNGIRKK